MKDEASYIKVTNTVREETIDSDTFLRRVEYDYSMPKKDEGKKSNKATKMKVVVQRVNKACLLMDNDKEWSEMKRPGLVFYISFTRDCTKKDCDSVAKKLMHLPVMTLGKWGDGSVTKSVFALCKEHDSAPLEIMCIPQAGLTSSFSSKRLQYHNQMPKAEGEAMYKYMCETIKEKLKQMLYPELSNKDKTKEKADETIPPSELFRTPPHDAKYSVLDMQGIPTHDERGTEVSKARRKKMIKMMKAQKKRYEKYLKQKKQDEGSSSTSAVRPAMIEMSKLKIEQQELKKMPRFIFGTFGNRQALKFESDMGPFTHTFNF